MFGFKMIKFVFVSKVERDIIEECERMEVEEEVFEELVKKKFEMRKIEIKVIVVEEVRKEEERCKNAILEEDVNFGDVEIDDEVNEVEEYEVWKIREFGKIKREKEVRGVMLREKEEVDKLRNMIEEERKEWERDNNFKLFLLEKSKKKWKFM